MGFAIQDSIVRVDRFKARGKWYDTIALDMASVYNEPLLHDAIERLLVEAGYPMEDWIYVCLEPYHQNAHPVMLKGRV